jgi:hypothetical protein
MWVVAAVVGLKIVAVVARAVVAVIASCSSHKYTHTHTEAAGVREGKSQARE